MRKINIFCLLVIACLNIWTMPVSFAAKAGAYYVETPLITNFRTFVDRDGVSHRWADVFDQIELVLTPMMNCDQLSLMYLYIDGVRMGNFGGNCSGRSMIISSGARTQDNGDPEVLLASMKRQLRQYLATHVITVEGNLINPDGTQEFIKITNPQLIDFSQGPVGLSKLLSKELMSLTKDPINIATGEANFFSEDFSIPGRGPALSLNRSYRSFSSFSGLFGYGWRTDFDINLTQNSNGDVTIYNADGSAIYFLNLLNFYIPSPGNYSTLVKNADNAFKLTDKHGNVSVYNASGRLSSITDRNGNQLTFVYNPSLTGGTYIQDTGGRRINFLLDTNQRIISASDPAGKTFQYGYDAAGNLVSIKDPTGAITTYSYDANHKVTTVTNANAHKTYFQYDAQGRAISNWQDNNVNKILLDYQPYQTTVTTDSLGNKNTYLFNDFGLLVDHTDPLGAITHQNWDGFMNRTTYTDELNNWSYFDYDAFGNLIRFRSPISAELYMTYTPQFNLLSRKEEIVNPLRWITYEYDTKGNQTAVTDPMGSKQNYTFDQYGNVTKVTDSLGRATSFVYDSYGNVLQKIDALGGKTIFSYDLNGNVLTHTDPLNNVTSYLYDNLNRRIKTTFANASTVTLSYDLLGHQTSITDQRGNKTLKTYDLYDRLAQIKDANNGTTTMTYDTEGRLAKLTDANGRATNYTYDANGRVLTQTNALNFTTQYTYDLGGNVISMTDANGKITSYAYDARNRLVKTTYPDNTTISNSYDYRGRIESVTDSSGQILYSYDFSDRILSKTQPGLNNVISYTYDSEGNQLTIMDQNNRIITNTYDALNRLTTVQDFNGTTTYNYDAASNVKSVKYPNGVSANYTYDKLNQVLTAINKRADLTTVSSVTNVYDLAGMITKKTLQDGSWTSYTYDALNQLRTEIKQNSTGVIYNYAYTYDAVGNRLSWTKNTTLGGFWSKDSASMPPQVLTNMTAAGFGSTATPTQAVTLKRTYFYDAAHRLTSWNYAANVSTSSFPIQTNTYFYDKNGNRLSKKAVLTGQSATPQQTSYQYDFENRLNKLTYVNVPKISGTQIDSSSYTAEGLRTQAVRNAVASFYLYDGSDVLVERNAAGGTLKSYTRGLDLGGGIGGLIAQNAGATTSTAQYYQYTDSGSASNLTTSSGVTFSSYNYDAFGNLLSAQATNDSNRYLFSTKEFDPRSGLYYFGARYYDPEVGRWLTPDPMGFVDGMNLYAYVNNNPINLIDPYGYLGERLGTGLAEDALKYYASQWSKTGNDWWVVPGFLSALWTNDTYLNTSAILTGGELRALSLGTFWKYVGPHSKSDGGFLTRGKEAPYGNDIVEAKNKLQLKNLPSGPKEVKIPWYEYVAGPRKANNPNYKKYGEGGGDEYYRGSKFPESDPNW